MVSNGLLFFRTKLPATTQNRVRRGATHPTRRQKSPPDAGRGMIISIFIIICVQRAACSIILTLSLIWKVFFNNFFMDKNMKTNKILQIAMMTTLLAAPMAASAYELGEKGISAADAKLYSQIGYDSTGRYEYLNGRAQDSLVEVSGKGAAKAGVKQSGKRVAKQAKRKPAVGSKEWEANVERAAIESARKEREYRKSGRSVIDDYL